MLRLFGSTSRGLSRFSSSKTDRLMQAQKFVKRHKSVFAGVKKGPPIEVFALNATFHQDKDPKKVNLGVGAYLDDDGKPWVFPVVRKVSKKIAATANHEYLPVLGFMKLRVEAPKLMLGEDSEALCDGRVVAVQSLSGTGALRLGADFLARHCRKKIFYYSDPTWENHLTLFMDAGFKKAVTYDYWDPNTRSLNFDSIMCTFDEAPEGAVVILHACAHNPTGVDPTQEQWKQIADLFECKKLFPFFDAAYMGLVSGDPEEDAWPVRYFVERGFEMLIAQSFAKSFGLYGERIGSLIVVQDDKKTSEAVLSQLTWCVRGNYSNAPAYGARIVSAILSDDNLRDEWVGCLCTMATRIKEMRQALYERLVDLKTPGSWQHIIDQIGMFTYTGLTKKQVDMLLKKNHIYILSSGRINMCGLNTKNVDYVAKCMNEVIKASKSDDC